MRAKIALILIGMTAILSVGAARAESYNLDLLYAVLSGTPPQYDNAEHWTLTTSLRIWMTKSGKPITVYLLSCYMNTGDNDTRRHDQKVELVSPSGEVVVTVTNPVELLAVQDKNKSFQRAYVVAKLDIPAMDTQDLKNFGMYTIKIYLDGDLIKKYPYPILAR